MLKFSTKDKIFQHEWEKCKKYVGATKLRYKFIKKIQLQKKKKKKKKKEHENQKNTD